MTEHRHPRWCNPVAGGLAVGGSAAVALTAALGGGFYPGQRVVVGVALALLLCWFGWQNEKWCLRPEEKLFLLLVVCGAISVVVVGMSPLAGKEVVTGWLVGWCLWVLARRAGPRSLVMGSSILIAAALVVVMGVGLEAVGWRGIRVGGLFESPNIVAALLVATLSLAGVMWSRHRHPILIPVAATLIAGVVLTGSRAGLLAILAVGAALVPPGRARAVALSTGGLAVAAVLGWRFVSQPEILAWFRPAIWLGVVRLWAAHPILGVGPGGLVDGAGPVRLLHEDHIGQHQFLITYAESTPLGLLVQTGIVGLVLAVAGTVIWYRRGDRDGWETSRALRTAVPGMVVMAAFHDFVTIEIVVWWWAVVLGFLEGRPDGNAPGAAREPESVVSRGVRALVLSGIVLWGIVQPGWARWVWRGEPKTAHSVDRAHAAEPWFAEPLNWRVRSLLEKEPWDWETAAEALARSREAVRAHPGASRFWMSLGHVHYRIINELGAWPDSVVGARAAFERAAELEPLQPWPWLEWARLERGLGDLDRSAELVERAIRTEPHAVRALLFLARIELDRGNAAGAREALEDARESALLRRSAGLKPYEMELLWGPGWQFLEIEKALQ